MKSILVPLFVVLFGSSSARTYGNSLKECEAFAENFASTCDLSKDVHDLSEMDGEEISCKTDSYCIEGSSVDENGVCTWTRKLCVSCQQRDEDVYITVQTNNLPNRCFGNGASGSNVPLDSNY